MPALKIAANLDALESIREYVSAVATEAGLDKKATYRLCLAVDEIATNIVVHGYEEAGQEGSIELRSDRDKQYLIISLEDTAPNFDPTQARAPGIDLPLEQRPVGGLGVYLAIRSVDKYQYERIGDRNRNLLAMRLNLEK